MITALTTGETPELRTLGSTMASVVENTAALPASDREAIAAYILSVPPRHSPNAVKLR
jgi:hypothetical protein